MGQVGLSHLPGLICMTQKGSASEIFPLPGTKAPGAPDGQEHCTDSRKSRLPPFALPRHL